MKKIMNRKGFTLVELLAVIVILAVIILVAMNAVIPQMEKARINAFVTEVQTFAKGAETWYTQQSISGNTTENCVKANDLIGPYVDKKSTGYEGIICIVLSGEKSSTKIALTNSSYSFAGDTMDLKAENVATGNVIGVEESDFVNDKATVAGYEVTKPATAPKSE